MEILIDRIAQILLLLGFCISAPYAFGTKVESGSIDMYSPNTIASLGSFTLSGSDFTTSGSIQSSGLAPLLCRPSCSVLDVQGTFGGFVSNTDFGSGAATVGGTTFPQLNWANFYSPGPSFSLFTITGPDIIVNGPGTYVGTFSFTGSLCGGPLGVNINGQLPCLVDLPQLTGSGIVTDTIEAFPNGQLHEVDVTYTFIAPEPSSMILVASAGLIFFLRRRKSNGCLD